VLLFLAMGSVAHPAANRNALEFFRAMVEGDAAAADAAAVVAPMLIKLCACSRLLDCRS
jgi:DNA-binding transcriptional regulator WhiA